MGSACSLNPDTRAMYTGERHWVLILLAGMLELNAVARFSAAEGLRFLQRHTHVR